MTEQQDVTQNLIDRLSRIAEKDTWDGLRAELVLAMWRGQDRKVPYQVSAAILGTNPRRTRE